MAERPRVKCGTCDRIVAGRVPPMGDGSVLVAYRHPAPDGSPCMGSGLEARELWQTLSSLTEPAIVWAPPELAQVEEEDEQRGPIQPKKSGAWCKKRLLVATLGGATLYQLQYMRCSTKTCRCRRTDDPTKYHGPYWVAYTTKAAVGGRVSRGGGWKQRYIGKDPSNEPPEFHEALARARR